MDLLKSNIFTHTADSCLQDRYALRVTKATEGFSVHDFIAAPLTALLYRLHLILKRIFEFITLVLKFVVIFKHRDRSILFSR